MMDYLDFIYQQAKATAEIEGHTFTSEDEKVIKSVFTGEINRKQLIDSLKEKNHPPAPQKNDSQNQE